MITEPNYAPVSAKHYLVLYSLLQLERTFNWQNIFICSLCLYFLCTFILFSVRKNFAFCIHLFYKKSTDMYEDTYYFALRRLFYFYLLENSIFILYVHVFIFRNIHKCVHCGWDIVFYTALGNIFFSWYPYQIIYSYSLTYSTF